MKRKWIYIIILVAVLALGGYGVVRARQAESSDRDFQTSEITRGTLDAVIDATGDVYANQTAILTWMISGNVAEVNVEVGDKVQKYQKLAELSRESLPQTIFQAEQELMNAQEALEELFDTAALRAAEARLTLARARESLDDAEYDLIINQPGNRASPEEVKSAKAKIVITENRLNKAENRLDNTDGRVAKAKAQIALTDAIDAYQTAVWYLNWIQDGADEIEMAILEGELDLAEKQLQQAELEYEEIKEGPTSRDISIAEARVAGAEAALDMVKLEAPFAGTVTEVDVNSGDIVSAGTRAFRIDDLNQLQVDVEVSEVDINQIKVGQDVQLRFDAVLDNEYQGTVTAISPVGIVQQGLVSFVVTAEVENADDQVKPGMTAATAIVVQHVEDVLRVPNRAVRWVDSSQVVYIQDAESEGGIRMVEISLGASSDDYSEVRSGDLEVGDQVILNPPNEPLDFGPPGSSGGGPFG